MTASSLYLPLIFIFILCLAIVTALFEIQIEGKNGWARALPTWRYAPPWYRKLSNGKELTGYHLYLAMMQLLLLHFPFIFSAQWNVATECLLLSFFFLFVPFWDFLWFVLNPAFGWKKFAPKNIWWFTKWIGPFPMDYYFCLFISAALAIISQALRQTMDIQTLLLILLSWVQSVVLILCLPTLLIVIGSVRMKQKRSAA